MAASRPTDVLVVPVLMSAVVSGRVTCVKTNYIGAKSALQIARHCGNIGPTIAHTLGHIASVRPEWRTQAD